MSKKQTRNDQKGTRITVILPESEYGLPERFVASGVDWTRKLGRMGWDVPEIEALFALWTQKRFSRNQQGVPTPVARGTIQAGRTQGIRGHKNGTPVVLLKLPKALSDGLKALRPTLLEEQKSNAQKRSKASRKRSTKALAKSIPAPAPESAQESTEATGS